LLAGTPSATHAQNGNATLPVVNGTPFTSGPVTVDSTHCGWNYVLGGGAFYTAVFPSASAMPLGCAITITNVDPMPTGANATGAKWVAVGVATACQARNGGFFYGRSKACRSAWFRAAFGKRYTALVYGNYRQAS
jgi:hypothetical protein